MKTSTIKKICFTIITTLLLSLINFAPVEAANLNYICYPLSGSITVYDRCTSHLGSIDPYSKKGTIFYSDEITILREQGAALYVRYPITGSGGKTKEGYIYGSSIIRPDTPSVRTLTSYLGRYSSIKRATSKIYTYRHPGSSRCGSVYVNDKVYIYGTYKGYTQIRYPISNGWKIAWINNNQLGKLS